MTTIAANDAGARTSGLLRKPEVVSSLRRLRFALEFNRILSTSHNNIPRLPRQFTASDVD